MKKILSSKWDPDYAPKIELLGPRIVQRSPIFGGLFFDRWCHARKSREFVKNDIHFPSIFLYSIRNALISGEYVVHDEKYIYIDSSINRIHNVADFGEKTKKNYSDIIIQCEEKIDERYSGEDALVFHNEGGGTWGHFVAQNLPRALLFLKHFPKGKIVVPSGLNGFSSNRFSQLMGILGISRSNLLSVERLKTYRFRNIYICDYLYRADGHAGIHPAAIELLSLHGAHESLRPTKTTNVRAFFLERSSGAREIENLDAVRDCLQTNGVECLPLGMMPAERQIECWNTGNSFSSTLGSDLTNLIFSRTAERIFVLSPDWFGDDFFFDLAAAKGVAWYELRCGKVGIARKPMHKSSFFVDVDALSGALDIFLAK